MTPLDVLAGELSDATEASAVWRALFRHARATTSADSILVAVYDAERQERTCVYFAEGDAEEDVSALPSMPLNDGPQSRAVQSTTRPSTALPSDRTSARAERPPTSASRSWSATSQPTRAGHAIASWRSSMG